MSKNHLAYNRLLRETKRLRATLEWHRDSKSIEIRVHAPTGYLWNTGSEPTLCHEEERSDSEFIDQAVDQILDAMHQGIHARIASRVYEDDICTGPDNSCECSRCEAFDPEFEELSFA